MLSYFQFSLIREDLDINSVAIRNSVYNNEQFSYSRAETKKKVQLRLLCKFIL